MATRFRYIAFALVLVLAFSLAYPSSCASSPNRFSNVPHGYVSEGIISKEAGTVSVWAYLESNVQRRSFSIFQTDDVRIALFFNPYYSAGKGKEISRIGARAVGNKRAAESNGSAESFPEASIIIDDGNLSDYRHAWYSPVEFPEGEWHLVTMKWDGWPKGNVSIYFDGKLTGSKQYSEKYDDKRAFSTMFSTGFLRGNGLGISDISFYPCALGDDEILALAGNGKPSESPWLDSPESYGGSAPLIPGKATSGDSPPAPPSGYAPASPQETPSGDISPEQRIISSTEFYSDGKKYLDVTSVMTVHVFFGLIPLEVEVRSKVDAETNATVEQTLPWWYFIVAD
jgi:hypothetical protein